VSVPGTPTARSTTPSPSTSPSAATEVPNTSPAVRIRSLLFSLAIFTKAFRRAVRIQEDGVQVAAVVAGRHRRPRRPTATSVTPSPSKSPSARSTIRSRCPVGPLIFCRWLDGPIGVQEEHVHGVGRTHRLPGHRRRRPSPARPSWSRSPTEATALPNRSLFAKVGPPFVSLAILISEPAGVSLSSVVTRTIWSGQRVEQVVRGRQH